MLDSVGYVRPLTTNKRDGSIKQSEGNGSSPENASSTNQPQPVDSAKQSERSGSSPGNAPSSSQPQPYKDAPSVETSKLVGSAQPTKTKIKKKKVKKSSPGNAPSSNQPQPYKDAPSGKILEILRVRNRFDMEAGDPHWSGGFRDLAFKVKVGFKVLFVDAVSSSAT